MGNGDEITAPRSTEVAPAATTLAERKPLFPGLEFGRDATPEALINRMEVAGIKWIGETGTKIVIRCISELQKSGTADAYAIVLGEVNDAGLSWRSYFQLERDKLGFGLVAQEAICLAAIAVQERLNRGEDPGVRADTWYIGDSVSPNVDPEHYEYVLYFVVRDNQVFVDWDYGGPDDEFSRDDRFLCSRK